MATSSKVLFNLSALKEKALESLDFRIQQKREELATHDSDEALAERITEWREVQQERVHALSKALARGEVDNTTLARFRVEEVPRQELHERRRAEVELARLLTNRSKMAAKAESLVADADGSLGLTKTQLAEFFEI